MPKRKTIRVIFIIAVILMALIFVLRQIIMYNEQRSEFANKTYDTIEDFGSVEEVAQYLDCKFIKQVESSSKNFKWDIYLNFKYDLYTNGASNQEYYYRAAILFSQVTGYENLRLIDDSRELVLAIFGDTQHKEILKLYINGEENYYGVNDTKEALESYKQITISKMEIQSSVLKSLISNNWEPKNVDFGSQESTFDGYDIYFDEGIEIKKVGTKVHNIVFTEKYADDIVSGIKVNTEYYEIANILGNPTFGKVDGKFIGYKGEKLYIFFEKNRVSVYPVEQNTNEQELLTLMETFRQEQDLKKFISAITDMWPDYDKYDYDSDHVDLVYALKGVKFEFNTQRDNGIIFYNNYNGSYISDLRQNKNNLPKYTYFVDENLVYENEKENYISVHNYDIAKSNYNYAKYARIEHNSKYAEKYKNDSKKFFVADEDEIDTLKIISIDRDYPPFEIQEVGETYFWLDDITLAYSVKNKGIYTYNAETMEKATLIEGEDEFNITNYQNGILYYDEGKFVIYGLANVGMTSYLWANDTTIIYSIRNQGIYVLNIATQERNTIIEGEGEFNLVSYQNGRLYYDDTYIFYILM